MDHSTSKFKTGTRIVSGVFIVLYTLAAILVCYLKNVDSASLYERFNNDNGFDDASFKEIGTEIL